MSLTFLAPFLLFLIVLLLVLLFLSLLQLLLSCWFCCCSLLIHPCLLFFFLLLSLFEQGWTAPSISWSSGNESFSFLSQDTSPWRQILSEVYTWCFWSFTASLFRRRILLFACPWDFIHEQDSMFLFRCISHNLSYTSTLQTAFKFSRLFVRILLCHLRAMNSFVSLDLLLPMFFDRYFTWMLVIWMCSCVILWGLIYSWSFRAIWSKFPSWRVLFWSCFLDLEWNLKWIAQVCEIRATSLWNNLLISPKPWMWELPFCCTLAFHSLKFALHEEVSTKMC